MAGAPSAAAEANPWASHIKDLFKLPDNLPIPVDDGACAHLFGTRVPSVPKIATSGDAANLGTLPRTDHLVLGLIGGIDWIYSTHGRTIEATVNLHEKGRPIAIVLEEHWMQAL